MNNEKWKNLSVTYQNGTAVVTIQRPASMNALNQALMKELQCCFTGFHEDQTVKVIILTGAGNKAFIAGADIKEMSEMDVESGRQWAVRGEKVAGLIESCPQPVIAAVNGYALGGGCEMALACDFIYASENACFGQPEVKWGINPCFGGTQRLARAVAPGIARELMYTARFIHAEEAFRIGLVNRVVSPDELMPSVLKTAEEIKSNGQTAVRFTKESINLGRDADIHTAIYHESQAFGLCFADPDQKKRMKSFERE
ncbi:MAG TPA: crotonase [Veillonellaceae bacterium]|nr:crotonase [Veillonellaceae bacterium]